MLTRLLPLIVLFLRRFAPALCVVGALLALHVSSVFAQAVTPEPAPVDVIGGYVESGKAFVGALGLLTALINLAKSAGWVKDGQAGKYVIGAGLLGLVARFALETWFPQVDLAALDGVLGEAAELLGVIVGARLTHRLLAGLPLIGKSYSA